jgi:predicted aldo/keto reductase-like oxidoreductase
MDRIVLPKTGLELSELGMGTVPMVRVPTDERVGLVRAVRDLGINWFDTARAYGDAEEVLGAAFKDCRDQVVIVSKSGAREVDALRQHLDKTLRALQSDYLDVFCFHGGGALKEEAFSAPGGLLETVEDARQAGKVRFLGFSTHNVEIALQGVEVASFDFAMVPANLISTQYIEGPFMDRALQRGMTVFAMKPFGGGRLGNARLCLSFLKRYPGVLPCVGIEKLSEMQENVRVWEEDAALSAQDWAEIERLREVLGDRFCRQCEYCKPCPQGINITQMNLMEAWTKQIPAEILPQVFGGMVDKAKDCVECRECVEKCPYDLPIPEMLRENIALYERVVGV